MNKAYLSAMVSKLGYYFRQAGQIRDYFQKIYIFYKCVDIC
jgi:hypothetical protein